MFLKWNLKRWPTSYFLLSTIWKWPFVKILIYHIFMVNALRKPICNMIIIKFFTWFTNMVQSYGIITFSRYYKFYKYWKSFQSFLEHICIFNTSWCTYFFHKYFLTSHHMKSKSFNFFSIWLFCVLAYHNRWKHCENPS